MRRNDEVQAALIAYLKSKSTITSELAAGAAEIREDQWQGTDFSYPNIRLRLISNVPVSKDCNYSNITFSCMVFSNQQNSLQADRIAGIISIVLHDVSFSSSSLNFSLVVSNIIPAVMAGVGVWRSEVMVSGIVSG